MSDVKTWSAVDAYFEGELNAADPALDAAVQASEAAGLPSIQISAAQGKLLQLLALAQGAKRILEVGTLGGYSGLQFREEGVLVTVITRNVSAQLPPIVKAADLEPFLKVRDKISQKDIAAWFAAHRDGPGGEPVPGA